ncbi:UNVERIFIED_ORG: sulfur carrier protein ThiS [Burkholderia contaminans]|nr:sulfur carrier protein ThiS [Burkholderia contaminans]
MKIINVKTVEDTYLGLTRAGTLNHYVDVFLRVMGEELNVADFTTKGVSAQAILDDKRIDILTPHGKVVGIVRHVKADRGLAAQATFSTVQIEVDGKTTASQIMSVTIDGQGFITAINNSALSEQPRLTDDDIIYEICFMLLSSLQDKLPSAGAKGFFG